MMRPTPTLSARERAQIGRATHFVASLFLGRGEYDKRSAATLEAARSIARDMRDGYGRRALVYAVTSEGVSVHVPDDLAL